MASVLDINCTGKTQTGSSSPLEFTSSIERGFLSWQQARIIDLAPVVVLDVLYMLFGVVGNSVVCYICMFRLQRTVLNNFILTLAVLELLGCTFTIPMEITEILNAYLFDFPVLCKTEKYFRKVIIFSTGCILIAIAMERYKRIVKPLGRRMTSCEFRLATSGALVVSAIMAAPEAVLAGSETIQTAFGTGRVCSTYNSDKYRYSIFPKLWGLLVVTIYVISIVWITTIYFLIATKIWKRGKVATDRRSRPGTPDSTLQRRVRCHSYHPRQSGETDTGGTTGAGKKFHHSTHPRCRSTYHCQDSADSTSSQHADTPRDKDQKLGVEASVPSEYQQEIKRHFVNKNSDVDVISLGDSNNHHLENEPVQMETKSKPDILLPTQVDMQNVGRPSDRQHGNHEINGKERSSEFNNHFTDHDHCQQIQTYRSHNQNHNDENNHQMALLNAVVCKLTHKNPDDTLRARRHLVVGHDGTILRSLTPLGSFHRKSRYSRKRTTFILFVMTLTTAISHLPHIAVMLYSLTHPGVTMQLIADESVIFNVAWNSFFISLAAHPFMYGFWNGRFKSALYVLFTGFKRGRQRTEKESGSSVRHS